MAGKYEPATGEHCKKCPGKTSCQFGIQYIEATKTKREEEAA
jgi:hypothetical protein